MLNRTIHEGLLDWPDDANSAWPATIGRIVLQLVRTADPDVLETFARFRDNEHMETLMNEVAGLNDDELCEVLAKVEQIKEERETDSRLNDAPSWPRQMP